MRQVANPEIEEIARGLSVFHFNVDQIEWVKFFIPFVGSGSDSCTAFDQAFALDERSPAKKLGAA